MTVQQSSDDRKVRYIGFYDDPSTEENIDLVRYTPDTPRKTVHMYDSENHERYDVSLIGYDSTGGWVSIEEAKEMVSDAAENVYDE